MKIYYALVCHNFQRRLCWVLSSIVQQRCSPFSIIVDIACKPSNGSPTTEAIAEKFKHIGLDVRLTYIEDDEVFARRGLIRNIQVQNAIAAGYEYLWFADADHVYHPQMFSSLLHFLSIEGSEKHTCIYSKAKVHTEVKSTDKEMKISLSEMPYIPKAYERAEQLPTLEHVGKCGGAPGNMQIVATKDVINLSHGVYTDPYHCRDSHLFKKGQRAKSDVDFRRSIGGSCAIDLPLQIHLNHVRDKEAGKHLEQQR